jgi:hypothetical protein
MRREERRQYKSWITSQAAQQNWQAHNWLVNENRQVKRAFIPATLTSQDREDSITDMADWPSMFSTFFGTLFAWTTLALSAATYRLEVLRRTVQSVIHAEKLMAPLLHLLISWI